MFFNSFTRPKWTYTELSEAERPSTNNAIGNINPKTDLNYRDATFKAATKATVVGYLSLASVPEGLEFGNNQVSNKTQEYRPTVNGDLVVSDTRGGAKKPWRLTLSQSEELTNGTVSLGDTLYYTSQLGEKQITTATQIVESEPLPLMAQRIYRLIGKAATGSS